jgi:SSS family solute:Na+ symporter
LVKKIRSYNVITIPEMAKILFGPKAERLTASLNFLNLLPIAYTISLGIFLKSLFGGSLFINTTIGVVLVTLWSLWGGFRAVVFSDIVQFFFMILAVVLVVIFSWMHMGSPVELFQKLPLTHLDWTGGESIATLCVWGFIALSTLVDPNFYQEFLQQIVKRLRSVELSSPLLFGLFLIVARLLGRCMPEWHFRKPILRTPIFNIPFNLYLTALEV